jgi:hypothetical protein
VSSMRDLTASTEASFAPVARARTHTKRVTDGRARSVLRCAYWLPTLRTARDHRHLTRTASRRTRGRLSADLTARVGDAPTAGGRAAPSSSCEDFLDDPSDRDDAPAPPPAHP